MSAVSPRAARVSRGLPTARRQFLTALVGSGEPRPEHDGAAYWIRVYRRAMACRFEVTLDAADGEHVPAATLALDEIDRLEDELSVFREGSIVSAINRRAAAGPVVVPPHLIRLLAACRELHRDTEGAFDITTTPLSRCWGFLRRNARVPDAAAIDAARALVGAEAIHLDVEAGTVALQRAGTELNLGAVGKGYAIDRAAASLRSEGVAHALLSAGRSSLFALGGRGGGWRVDLVSPLVEGRQLARLMLRNAAVGTSGAGEQFVVAGGVRYGHVIDPRTGWPCSGVVSATVVASSAAQADALSTAFLIGGVELAARYCEAHPRVLVLMTPDDGSGRPIAFGGHPGARVVEQ